MKTKITLMLAFVAGSIMTSYGQVFFTETFEGAMDPGTDIPVGWTETGLSTDGIWSTADAGIATSAYLTYPAALDGTEFAYTNDDDCNCDKSADRMILPVQDFSAYVDVILTSDIFLSTSAGDILTCEVSTDGGGTWTVVNTYVATSGAWVDNISVSLTAYAGMGAVTVSWLYNDTGSWAYGCGVDDVKMEGFTAPVIDAAMTTTNAEYTQIPLNQVTAIGGSGEIFNVGAVTVTNAIMTVNVYDGLAANVYTASSAPDSILAGASLVTTVAGYTPSAIDVYTVEQIVSITEMDINISNDTSYYTVAITDSTYARDNSQVAGLLGIGAGNGGQLGQQFVMNAPDDITSVSFWVGNSGGTLTGEPLVVSIYDMVAGVPNAMIAQTDTVYLNVDTNIMITAQIAGGYYSLPAGDFVVLMEEVDSTSLLGYSNNIFTTGTTWLNWPTIPSGTWANNEAFGFNVSYILRPNFGPVCIASTASMTASSCGDYTAPSGAVLTTSGTYTDVIPNYCGGDSTITITLTVTTLDLSVTEAGGVLTSGMASSTYQWIDCGNNTDIAGETGQTYTPVVTGSYAVIVTNGSCSDTSACTTVTVGGIADIAALGGIEVYPNPSNGTFSVNVNGITTNALSIEVLDMTGRVIETRTFDNVQGQLTTSISLEVQEGAYLLRISANGETATQSIVISKK